MPIDSYIISYSEKQLRRKRVLLTLSIIVLVLIALQIIFTYILRPHQIASTSMQPEFSKQSAVFLSPLINGHTLFSSTSSLTRGTLVTVDNNSGIKKSTANNIVDFICGMVTFQKFRPYDSLRWGDSEIYRIVGIPGDTLYMNNHIAYIREGGSSHFLTEFELADVNYDVVSSGFPASWNMSVGVQGISKEISLKKDEYFLLCDNRLVSTDSRIFGSVLKDNIDAKVIAQYFPVNQLRAIR